MRAILAFFILLLTYELIIVADHVSKTYIQLSMQADSIVRLSTILYDLQQEKEKSDGQCP